MTVEIDLGAVRYDLGFNRGDDVSLTWDVAGDCSADDFSADMTARRDGEVTEFVVVVGSYDSDADTTPVTISLTDAVTTALAADVYLWRLRRTQDGATRTLIGATLDEGRSKITVL